MAFYEFLRVRSVKHEEQKAFDGERACAGLLLYIGHGQGEGSVAHPMPVFCRFVLKLRDDGG